MEDADLVVLRLVVSLKRHLPSGFMECLAFHTVHAIMEATASFRHLRLALRRTTSELTLSESLVLVMVRAVDFIHLLISSVTTHVLSSLFSLTGIVTEQADKIFPIRRPFAKVDNTLGGIEKLSRVIKADLVLASRASLCKKGIVVKLESNSTPSRLITGVAEMGLEPTSI